MTVDDLDMDMVRLLTKDLMMEESLDMTLFVITNWTLEYRNTSSLQKGVKMTIVLKRKIMNEMMTTYLPSVLLILITYATTFFKPYFFEAALSVNLTTMLVMTTIFMTVMQMLPATAYIKMIDVFLIFGQLYPFSEVILLTIMEYHREGDGSGEVKTADASQQDILDVGNQENMDTPVRVEDMKITDTAPETVNEPVDKLYWYKVTGENNARGNIQLILVLFRGKDSAWSCGFLLYWIHHHSFHILLK